MNSILVPVIGGILIGLAAATLLWTLGRVAGISGILWQSLLRAEHSALAEKLWRVMFLLGLIAGPAIAINAGMIELPKTNESGWGALIIAGLLVGFGTRLGSGCTSGHGICGIARFSTRSIVATLVFMSLGIITVTVMRHVF